MRRTTNRRQNAPLLGGIKQKIAAGIFLLIVAAATIAAFVFVRNLVASWTLGSLPGAPVFNADSQTTPAAGTAFPGGGDLLQPETGPTPQPWDGASRITILLMGLDYDDTEARKIPRTDTMMVVSMDPKNKTAGILSIPRDMWVSIPGFDYAKINTAYFLGESYKLPGGGAGLAVQTVEDFLGVPINYYAQIDFDTFVKFIDEIGGVDINVKKKIKLQVMGGFEVKSSKTGKTFIREEITLRPGVQTLDGRTALAYARNRYTEGGDYDRAVRQQEVIDAVRARILNFKMLPNLIAKAPRLYQELSSGVKTNLSLEQIIQLALFASQIPENNIKHGLISPQMAISMMSFDGQAIQKPIMEKVREVRDSVLATSGPAGPSVVSADSGELMKKENARVSIRNGSYNNNTDGLANRSADYFRGLGMNVTEVLNESPSDASYIIDVTGKPYTISYLAYMLNLQPAQIRSSTYDPNSPVDVILVLGNDWANNNPMGQ